MWGSEPTSPELQARRPGSKMIIMAKPPAKKMTTVTVLRAGQLVKFRLGGRTWHGRVVESLGGRGSKRAQLVRVEMNAGGREAEPLRFSVPAELVHAQ